MTSWTIIPQYCLSTLLLSALLTVSSGQYLQSSETVDEGVLSSPSLFDGGQSPSFSLKERFKWTIDAFGEPHSRQKRIAHFEVRFPHGTWLELKWALNFPVPMQPKYKVKLQIAIPITMNLPTYLVDDAYTPDFDTLFGTFREGDEALAKEEPIEVLARRKRDLHVTDRLEVYDNFKKMINSHGLPGHECLLRTVCEVAEAPLQYGVFGDFLNVMFTPSVAAVSASSADLQELDALLAAEEVGRQHSGEGCHEVFADCPTSVFDSLPLVHHKKFSF